MELIRRYASLEGARALDIGCGVGTYVQALAESGSQPIGIDLDWDHVRAARSDGLMVAAAAGESIPLGAGAVDFVLLHEVLEHVADDEQTVAEVVRVLSSGGRAAIFVPNRLWPFETHGLYWRGSYRFGNWPLVNYLPDPLRNRVAPHVRAYTAGRLRALFEGQPVRVVVHTQVLPGYDKVVSRHPRVGRLLRHISLRLESSPLRLFGLSHLLVVERL